MIKNISKNSHLNIIIFGNLTFILVLLLATIAIITLEQKNAFKIENIKVLELKLPSLELNKYRQLEKKANSV